MGKTSKAGSARAKGVDLGQLQATFEHDQRAWHSAERALARAQEARDKARAQALASDNALKDGTRTVLG